ncbi:DUF4440 domain-containing protein [Tabrizicola sp. BL-A-41-H6]|uniref:nuclear transport factor 2 family protein n=1 Tax=Tabrizicola sp. BL-A-41-H6 TaxID=3421107 RepID=UPI003D666299
MTPASLPTLENALWQAATTYDRATMERTFAPDFIEFGRNGTFYTREVMLAAPNAAQDVRAVLHDIVVRPLSDTIALVTYVSEVRYPSGTEWSNRSSIWDASNGDWQVRFHQGTPCEART